MNRTYKPLYSAESKPKAQVHSAFLILAVLIITFIVFNIVGLSAKLLLVMMAIVVFAVSFINTELALFFLIFSMLLSPEFSAGTAGTRDIAIRGDDIFLGVVLLGWFAKMAVHKDLALFKYTPLNGPIALFVMTALISTLFGTLKGSTLPLKALFYWIKSFEYFLLFFMVSNIVTNKKQAKRYIYMILMVAIITCLYAWFQRLTGVARVSTPFEGRGGEANTLGGYIVMIMMICLGILFNVKDKFNKLFSIGMLALSAPVLLFTLSRGSWVAFVPASIVFGLIIPKGKVVYGLAAVVMVLFAASIFPKEVQDRFYYTFEEQKTYNFLGRQITLDESAAARVDSWSQSWAITKVSPLLGHGVGFAGVVDNQYARILMEQGVLGLLIFLALLFRIFSISFWIKRSPDFEDMFFRGLVCGYIAALVSLMFHSLSAATFIIIRIMMPFWFITAIVIKLPYLTNEDDKGVIDGSVV